MVVNPEHLEGGDGTMRLAMQLWSSRNGPCQYNQWQSLYFSLKRMGYRDDEAPDAEEQRDLQARIRQMFNQIGEEMHGPDFLAQAVLVGKKDKPALTAPTAAMGSH